jgi:hypothetical protein
MMAPDLTAYTAEFEAMAERATEFLDAGFDGPGWPPSALLRIGFYVLLTGPNPASSATFANDTLNTARRLFREGKPCNPFALPVTAGG